MTPGARGVRCGMERHAGGLAPPPSGTASLLGSRINPAIGLEVK